MEKNDYYIDFRDTVLDKISPSFCAAKWLNATIWLSNGTTSSCHHPPATPIIDSRRGETIHLLKKNPSMLHNTTHKKDMRSLMLSGKRPSECDYCWKIEDLGSDKISDRVFKSVIYDNDEINKCVTEYNDTKNSELKTLEIAFDSNCNFACSYCNPSFSTTWQTDIKTHGHYKNLTSDGNDIYTHDGSKVYLQNGTWALLPKKDEENPYINAFWDWWPELSKTLTELRVTGGEATMSPEFWKLVEWWQENGTELDIQFAVNSNLGVKGKLLDRLINATHSFKKFSLYSSCESVGHHAEYIRDGLVWDDWVAAVEKIITLGKITDFNVMMTVNSLSLFGITDFLDYCNNLKEKYGRLYGVCSLNILRFPSFMSVGTLPINIRLERANHIERWLDNVTSNMHDFEKDSVRRLISYLREIDSPHSSTSSMESRQKDFKNFYMQYDARRGKNFVNTFPELKDWYENISPI